MSERLGIEIDYCPQCRGIWLDRGELDKIIERSANETTGYKHSKHQNFGDHSQHGYYDQNKKKHWLNDLLG
jgi:Zn-finger nucleic acid-binding protein